MGNRNLTLVSYNGKYQICHYRSGGSWPEDQGLAVLRFVRDPHNVQRLQDAIDNGMTMSKEDYKFWMRSCPQVAKELEVDASKATINADESESVSILEKVAAATETIGRVNPDDFFFLCSGHCEWAYVVDLDNHRFETFVWDHTNEDDGPEIDNCRFRGVVDDAGYEVPLLANGYWVFEDLPTDEAFCKYYEKRRPDYQASPSDDDMW